CCSSGQGESVDAAELPPYCEHPQCVQYQIQNMDGPREERLIRDTLGGLPGIFGLDFNLMNRVLSVHHRLESQESILRALQAIGMPAEHVDRAKSTTAHLPASVSGCSHAPSGSAEMTPLPPDAGAPA